MPNILPMEPRFEQRRRATPSGRALPAAAQSMPTPRGRALGLRGAVPGAAQRASAAPQKPKASPMLEGTSSAPSYNLRPRLPGEIVPLGTQPMPASAMGGGKAKASPGQMRGGGKAKGGGGYAKGGKMAKGGGSSKGKK